MMPLPGSSLPVDLVEHILMHDDELEDYLSFGSDADSSDDESDDDSSTSGSADFILDIRLLEEDNRMQEEFQRRRRERRTTEQEEDPLETDSLKLIRRRVPQQEHRAAPEARNTPASPSITKNLDAPLSFQVCEVPLGVSLKDIIPSMFRTQTNFRSFAPGTGSQPSSEDLLEGIDRALEIVTLSL
jgi:hypothetical protein